MVEHQVTRFTANTPIPTILGHLCEHGYAIVEGAASTDVLDRLEREVAPFLEASAAGRDIYDGIYTRRTGALIARCPAARELVMHPTATGVAKEFLSHATAVQLHLTQLISIAPGETDQKLHRDQMAFDFYPFPSDYHVQCNTMWALTDFTLSNGATRIRPGTSSLSDAASESRPIIQAVMPRGSVLFYDGKVIHAGGANTGDDERRGVNITYSVGWVRQEENQFLACPPDIARTLDDDLLKMMGYQQGAFALGYVGDQQDPLASLRGEDTKTRLVSDFGAVNETSRDFVDELETVPEPAGAYRNNDAGAG